MEIVVRDDKEDDKTEEVITDFKRINIRYFRGEREGLDEALLFLTKKATGKFVWWIGDDLLVPGAVFER